MRNYMLKDHSNCFVKNRLLGGKVRIRENSGPIAINQERDEP